MKIIVYLGLLALACNAKTTKQWRSFPDDFIFGTATASYQIEGAWNADDKGENIWDHMTHTKPYVIDDMSNGDIADDSYHNYKRDVEMMRELGIDAYRLSLSWSRILPTGFANHVSEAGVEFYNNYINEMLKYNIEPMITLYHWDLPQKLQDLGGWANPYISQWFEDYARVAYEKFGDRVKYWITMNEPREICYQGYGTVTKAPILNATGVGDYLCVKNLLLAHAKAYHLYDKEFKQNQGGTCGITYSISWYEPMTNSDEDILATDLMDQAQWGIYAHPVFGEDGGYPKELEKRIAEKSAQQGYPRSRLPPLTDEEKKTIKGSADFFGVNHYSGEVVSATKFKIAYPVPSLYDDVDAGTYMPADWPQSASSNKVKSPHSLYNVLNKVREMYDPIIYITENGWSSTPDEGHNDIGRIDYYKNALDDAARAIEDGVKLKVYMAWSLMDNYEWMRGYTERFGLYQVDYSDPARTRTPRKSAFVYKQIVKTHLVDHDYDPDITTLTMTIDEGH